MKIKRSAWIHIALFATMILYLVIAPLVEVKFFIHQGKPIQLAGALPEPTDLVNHAVDVAKEVVFQGEKIYRVNGWSFLTTATDLADYDTYFVLNSPRRDYVYPAAPSGRRDIPRAFPDVKLDLANSGFVVFIARDALPPGQYRISLLYQHKGTGERVYQKTQRMLVRTPNQLLLMDLEETP